jgi:hypothetical protein
MAHYNFEKDLEEGQLVEKEAVACLHSFFPEIGEIEFSKTKGYDIRASVGGTIVTFEVKNDLMAGTTGNVAIEYQSRGKDSGLTTTLADYWVYKIAGRFWLLPTALLRQKLFQEKAYHRDLSGGDPGSDTRMLLVRVATFQSWGVEIF